MKKKYDVKDIRNNSFYTNDFMFVVKNRLVTNINNNFNGDMCYTKLCVKR